MITRFPRPKSGGPSILPTCCVLLSRSKTQLESRVAPLWRPISSSPRSSFATRAHKASNPIAIASSSVAARHKRFYSTARRLGYSTSVSLTNLTEMTTAGSLLPYPEVISSLPGRFTRAKDAGDLFFFPSTVNTHEEHGVQVSWVLCFHLRQQYKFRPDRELCVWKESNSTSCFLRVLSFLFFSSRSLYLSVGVSDVLLVLVV